MDKNGAYEAEVCHQCPKRGLPGLIHQEGCDVCTSCDYPKCA